MHLIEVSVLVQYESEFLNKNKVTKCKGPFPCTSTFTSIIKNRMALIIKYSSYESVVSTVRHKIVKCYLNYERLKVK
jgi:hypothetical protein